GRLRAGRRPRSRGRPQALACGAPLSALPAVDDEAKSEQESAEPAWSEADVVQGLQAFYITVDEVVAGVTAKTALPCRRGCSYCCRDVPPALSDSEWLVVLDALRAMAPQVRRPLLEQARELYAQNLDLFEALEREPSRLDELARTRSYTCPFLVDEACS